MAFPISITKASYFSFLVFLGIAICLEAKSLKLKKTEMVLFMHDFQIATKVSNVTNIPVAGNPKTKMSTLTFGSVFILDDALTVGIKRDSTEIGRGHGTYINCALDGTDVYLMVSLVFASKKYNGSTIEIQGSDRLFLKYRDVSVVGGTGIFRMARGWATLETVVIDFPTLHAVIKFNMTVYHH